jgi:hypothetical protein
MSERWDEEKGKDMDMGGIHCFLYCRCWMMKSLPLAMDSGKRRAHRRGGPSQVSQPRDGTTDGVYRPQLRMYVCINATMQHEGL